MKKMEQKFRQSLSAPGLLAIMRKKLAVFGMKFPSLLQFDTSSRNDPHVQHNLKSLYGLQQTPCDTQVREILDPVDPKALRPAFTAAFAAAQRGKALEQFQYYRGSILVSLDGTGYFSSHKVHCDNCCLKEHRDGTVTYYHQMLSAAVVHPDIKYVVPLAPEAIIKQDGKAKNDCERNAAKRMLHDLRREHVLLSPIRWERRVEGRELLRKEYFF